MRAESRLVRGTFLACLLPFTILLSAVPGTADDPPWPAVQRERSITKWRELEEMQTRRLAENPNLVDALSRRGDYRFFLGDFQGAVEDFEAMVRLNPDVDSAHWRLGIAYYYVGKPEQAAAQFDKYHSYDQVDRENGIWRYLSHYRANGKEAARRELLKYEKDDREPFPAVYRLFAGETTPEKILADIASADISKAERKSREFYAQLYIGLNFAAEGQPEQAREHLREAVANDWAHGAGYGPPWMWQVGRLQWEILDREQTSANP